MDWLLELIKEVGGYAIGGILATIFIIIIISMMDRHGGKKPPDPFAPPKTPDESSTRE